MCGIGGVYLVPGADLDVPEVLSQMLKYQGHRGPDGKGSWWSPKARVGLCHNRLAILDLSEAGLQPMHSVDGLLSVVYNGEVYNWQELRALLEDEGVRFRTKTDTEVLLEAYRKYGTEVVQYLRGMFAFALFDHRDGTLFCARDRIGKKPFVYAETPSGFAFASEIPAVMAMPDCETSLHHAAIAAMIIGNMRHIPDPHTAYSGIKRLRPGHAMVVKKGRIEEAWRYWTPRADTKPVTPERLRDVLEDSVKRRMVADVPVGALLSGGVDSSAVVHLMRNFTSEPVRTYALGFDKDDEDLRRARTMAQKLGCLHKEFYFDPERQLSIFRRLLDSYGEPIMLLPLIHTYELCRAVHEDGIKVVLSGHGADELFCGYTGHLRTALFSAVLPYMPSVSLPARWFPRACCFGPLAIVGSPHGKRKAALYRANEQQAWDRVIAPEIREGLTNLVAEEIEYWGRLLPEGPYIDESNFVSLMVENAHSVTIASDLPAMMASTEMRAPFLDQEIISAALATHYRQKVPSFIDASRLKNILKTAVQDLVPQELLYAPKRGFGYGIQERDVLSGPWRRIGDELFDRPDDAGGLFVKQELRTLWNDDVRPAKRRWDYIAKHLAVQLWLREHQRQAA